MQLHFKDNIESKFIVNLYFIFPFLGIFFSVFFLHIFVYIVINKILVHPSAASFQRYNIESKFMTTSFSKI